MTTPVINTPNGVISDALVDCGLLMEGQEPSPEQFASGLRRLRDLMALYMTQGLKLWLKVDTEVPLVAGQARYSIGPGGDVNLVGRPLSVEQGYYLFTATNVRRQLSKLAWEDYLNLGQAGTLTSNRGPISQFQVDKQAALMYVTFWLTPDTTEAANGSVHLLLKTYVNQPIQLDETINFPDEWRVALRWGLADDWSTGQPDAVVQRCAQRAKDTRMALEDFDVEDAEVKFEADATGYGCSSFR